MNVIVTGGAGFIGSRLVGRLLQRGDQVHVVDDFSLGSAANLAPHRAHPGLAVTQLDCCEPRFAGLLRECGASRVYHLAANSDILAGSREPRTDLNRTFLTTFSVVEAMRQSGARELVLASTSAIYGDVPGAIVEDHGPLRPVSLYGAAKLASEAYASAYAHLFGIRAWIFRFPNVVGPNLTHGVIFDFVRRLAKERTRLEVLGDGTQRKPYLDVDDLLEAIFVALESGADPVATYNVAGDGMTSVREIAEEVRTAMRLPDATIEYGSSNRGWPGDVPTFQYDTSKIRALGWKARRSSNEAVAAAIGSEVERCKPSS